MCVLALIACGSEPVAPPRDKPVPADARPIGAAPEPIPVGDLPVECGVLKALLTRLAQCEALGPQRTLLLEQYDRSWKAWSKLPPSERATAAVSCRAASEAVRLAASGPCGW